MPESQTSYPAKRHYRGDVARGYLEKRAGSEKWRLEQRAVERLLKKLPKAATVIDAPVGTSRFSGLYDERGLGVFGVDVSLSMLTQARSSLGGLLACGDVGRLPFATDGVDFVLSVRFLNWLPPAELEMVLAEFRRVARQGLIVGIRTRERIRPSHIVAFLKDVLSKPVAALGRLTRPIRRRASRHEPSLFFPLAPAIGSLFERHQLEIVSIENIADGTEYSRRAFRHTPLKLYLLRLSESKAAAD